MHDREDLITAPEMAARLGVSEATVYRYLVAGRIPATRHRWGLRHRYAVRRADFERVAPSLMGLDRDDTIQESEEMQSPGHVALSLG